MLLDFGVAPRRIVSDHDAHEDCDLNVVMLWTPPSHSAMDHGFNKNVAKQTAAEKAL